MVTSDAGGRATRTLFAESMNVLALKHGCSAWCLGALIAFPHVIRTPHPRRARARLPPRTGCRTAETNFRAVRLRRARARGVLASYGARAILGVVTYPNKCPKTRFLPQQMSKCVLAINSINFAFFLIRTPLLVVRYLYK